MSTDTTRKARPRRSRGAEKLTPRDAAREIRALKAMLPTRGEHKVTWDDVGERAGYAGDTCRKYATGRIANADEPGAYEAAYRTIKQALAQLVAEHAEAQAMPAVDESTVDA